MEVGAAEQVIEAFSQLAPLFRDNSLKLEPNPRVTKQRKRETPGQTGKPPQQADHDQQEALPVMQLVRTMANLIIKHDQELQNLRKMDQFILFLSSEPLGALHLLAQESKIWKQKMEASTPHMLSLRQHLTITLLKALRQRAEQIVQAKDTEELYLTSVQKGLILKDRSFLFHKWDHAEKKLVLDKKTPISAAKMGQHLEELLEMLQDPYLVIRFHSLKPHSQDLQSVPWRLQLNLRSDRPYELFLHLAHSSLWMLVGASMKPHSLGQSGLATAVQSLMNGKGKGKGKRAKQELTP